MAALQRFRRRLRLRAFVLHVPVATAIAMVVDVALVATRHTDAVPSLLARSLVLAAVAAYVVTLFRTPSLSATARIVDRELGLQDRATSGLEFLGTMDTISRLVVADASSRLTAIPVSRLALTVPPPARWAIASTVAISMLLLVMPANSTRKSAADSLVAMAATAGPAVEGARGRSARMPVATSVPGAITQAAERELSVSALPLSNRMADPRIGATADAAAHAIEATTVRNDATKTDVSGARHDAPAAAPDHRTLGPGANSTNRAPGRAPAAEDATSAAFARGRGARAPSRAEASGGGVSNAALAGGGPGALRSTWAGINGRQSPAYAAAYARAEAATRSDRVPPNLRSYVRAYFVAIRPTSDQ